MTTNTAPQTRSSEELLAELLQSQKKATRHTRIASFANLALAAVLLIAVVTLVPKTVSLISRMHTTLTEIDTLAQEAGEVARSANAIASSAAELAGNANEMIGNVNEVVTANTDAVTEALQKINGVDFARLNEAITNLNNVVRPLSDFFQRFS